MDFVDVFWWIFLYGFLMKIGFSHLWPFCVKQCCSLLLQNGNIWHLILCCMKNYLLHKYNNWHLVPFCMGILQKYTLKSAAEKFFLTFVSFLHRMLCENWCWTLRLKSMLHSVNLFWLFLLHAYIILIGGNGALGTI